MKEFIESFKIAVINFFSGKSENESVDEMKLDTKGNIVYIHTELKEKAPKEELTIFDIVSCAQDHFNHSSDSVKHNGCVQFASSDDGYYNGYYKEGEENIRFTTPSQIKEERKVIKVKIPVGTSPKMALEKINKVKTKSKPKKALNITIIHNKKPVTITEFSKISGIPPCY